MLPLAASSNDSVRMDGGQLMCCLGLRSLSDDSVVNIVQISVFFIKEVRIVIGNH